MRWLPLAVAVLIAAPALAQDRAATLADIRQELGVLNVEINSLKRELSTTGSAMGAAASGDALQRIDSIEGALRQLTSKTEELENRINRIVQDGTNRVGDMEFRLRELEGGDLGSIPETPPLGGEQGLPQIVSPQPEDSGVQLAVGEQADFDAARKLSEEGKPAEAVAAFDGFLQNYPRSPLTAQAQLLRGKALTENGNLPAAGRAYLEAFTLAETQDAAIASEALFSLGSTLGELGQTQEACVMLGQVGATYPGTEAASRAQSALAGLSCS